MFEHARLKLTIWYLVISMAVSLLFSFGIYSAINSEFTRFENVTEMMKEAEARGIRFRLPHGIPTQRFDPEFIASARARLLSTLGLINLVIWGVAGAAGYFLAGRTLRPIKSMVDEQNRFITDASHELRTPLTSLRSEIEVGLRNKSLSLAKSKKLLESNLEEVISLQTLSDSLLELAQTGKPANSTYFTTVSIRESINASIKKLNGSVKKKQITIRKNIEDVSIRGIPDRIIELLTILIDNAIKYSPKKSTIKVSALRKKDMVEIKVEDQGVGIDEKDLPHIFDRFYRSNKSRSKEKIDGFGLGLSIAKKIVTTHGGLISVKSKLGNETIFTVSLPQNKSTL